jgi:hypothetical protein
MGINSMDFNITQQQKDNLFESGYQSTITFLQQLKENNSVVLPEIPHIQFTQKEHLIDHVF